MAKIHINLSDNIATWVDKTNQLIAFVGDSANLTTTEDSSIVGAINELDSDIGARPHTNLTTFNKTLTGAINEIDSSLGAISSLTTADKTSAVAAINELDAELGTITSGAMGTTASTVSTAIAELDGRLDSNDVFIGPHSLNTFGATTITGTLNEFKSKIGNMTLTGLSATTLSGAHRELRTELGDVTSLTTPTKTDAVTAINELDSDLDVLVARVDSNDIDITELQNFVEPGQSLNTTATTVADAINEHEVDIGNMTFTGLSATNISAAVRELRTELGNHTSLTTTATSNAVAAINELDAELGTITSGAMGTTASTVSTAIAELDSDRDRLVTFVEPTQALTTTATTLADAINEHDAELGTISSGAMGTTASTVGGAIAELETEIDTLNSYTSVGTSLNTSASTLAGAINEIHTQYDSLNDTKIGSLADLDTNDITDVSSIVNAINDVAATASQAFDSAAAIDTKIGSLANLNTTIKSSIVNAINELEGDRDSNNSNFVSRVRGSLSAGGDLTYNSSTGQYSVNVANIYTTSNFDSDLDAAIANSSQITYSSDNNNFSIANDAVTLGTHTTGNYVQQGATSGNGISGSVNSEGGTFTVTSNATTSNTGSTIVFRDGSGNFSAGTITASLSGTATNATNVNLAANTTDTSLSYVMFGSNATGNTRPSTDTTLLYKPSENRLYAGVFDGSGAGLTSLNASNISSGTISDAHLPSTITSNITGSAATLTTARAIAVDGAVTGSASFDGSANITITTTATSDPTITLTGAVTGSGTMTNLGSVSITTTATADPILTLSGDATGSATFTNLGNATLSVSLAANTVNSNELASATLLRIYNSAGTIVKSLYGAGA